MLAQAKRLADLQKRRELKQAGLMSQAAKKKAKRSKEIDLGVEIPFHKPAPAGIHDTSDEVSRTNSIREKRLKQIDFKQVNENRYRSRDFEEAQRRKADERRFKMLEDSNKKYAEQAPKEEEAPARPRGSLQLPAPMVTDDELAQLASTEHARAMQYETGGSSVTQALLGDYSDRPLPTPMRTPATSGLGRDLVREASQLRTLERGQTPLLMGGPGEAFDDEEMDEGDRKIAAAPTPQLPDRAGAGRTPIRRDAFGLNDAASVGGSTFATSQLSIRDLARQQKQATKRARMELEAALAALPAPQYEYELAVPSNGEDMQVETVVEEADQADLEAAERAKLQREAEKRYEQQSSVLKRKGLPRPARVSGHYASSPSEDEARKLVHQETILLLQHDATVHPLVIPDDGDGKKRKKAKIVEPIFDAADAVVLDDIAEDYLAAAKESVSAELIDIQNDGVLDQPYDSAVLLSDVHQKMSPFGADDMVYTLDGWVDASSDQVTIGSLKLELQTLEAATSTLRKRNDKAESKLGVVNGGYVKRCGQLGEQIVGLHADIDNSEIEESVYELLRFQERTGGERRLASISQDVERLRNEEAELQRRYGALTVEKRRLLMKSNANAGGN
ncbi:hypothetical protein MPSEU_000695700 [Mayamaea pseudoterrestris]|nr:hypothetical protein MPSEU_000695700 [Mayamaea pseudoterrestris]